MGTFLIAISIVFSPLGLSYLYSAITGKKSKHLIDIEAHYGFLKEKGGLWVLIFLISAGLLFIFNQIVRLLWLVTVLFLFIIEIFRWLYENIFAPTIVFLLKIIFHYLIKWPWWLFRLSFDQFKNATTKRTYKMSAIGLFVSMLILFLFNYFQYEFDYPPAIMIIFGVTLAQLPLAWIFGTIASWRNSRESENHEAEINDHSSHGFKTIQFICFFIVSEFGLLLLELALVSTGLFKEFGITLNGLFSGPNIILAALLILNTIIILFAQAIAPTFLLYHNGPFLKNALPFLNVIKSKFLQYIFGTILALPMMIILSILPLLFLAISLVTTGYFFNSVYSYRINTIEGRLNENQKAISLYGSNDLFNAKQVTDLQFSEFLKNLDERQVLIEKRNELYLNNFYFKKYFTVVDFINKIPLFLQPVRSKQEINRMADQTRKESSLLQKSKEEQVTQIILSTDNITKQMKKLVGADSTMQNFTGKDTSRLRVLNEELISLDIRKERITDITSHKQLYLTETEATLKNAFLYERLAYIFLGIWNALLWALVLAFMASLFGNLYYAIYSFKNEPREIYIKQLATELHTKNRNQPLLGISVMLIFPAIFFIGMQFISVNDFFKNINIFKSMNNINRAPLLNETFFTSSAQSPAPQNISAGSDLVDAEIEQTPVNSFDTPPPPPPSAVGNEVGVTAVAEDSPSQGQVFTVVEVQPRYPGGQEACAEFLAENIHYPREAKELGIQGKVFVTFVVESDGSITDVRVLRGIGGGCDEEAVRVVKSMRKWLPGIQRGDYVRAQFNLPVKFTLQ